MRSKNGSLSCQISFLRIFAQFYICNFHIGRAALNHYHLIALIYAYNKDKTNDDLRVMALSQLFKVRHVVTSLLRTNGCAVTIEF